MGYAKSQVHSKARRPTTQAHFYFESRRPSRRTRQTSL